MKKAIGYLLIIVMIMITGSAGALESAELMAALLNAATEEEPVYGDTVSLGNALEFSVPADWEKTLPEDLDESIVFWYTGNDPEGNQVSFAGMIMENAINGDYDDLKEYLAESRIDYIMTEIQGHLIFLCGDDRTTAVGMCMTQDQKILGFGFDYMGGSASELMQSDKLMKDMTAILQSIQIRGTSVLMDDAAPASGTKEAGN